MADLAELLMHHSLRVDPRRKEPRVKIRLHVRPENVTIPLAHDGARLNNVPQGVSEQIVYKSDLPKIMARVDTEQDKLRLAAAEDSYDLNLRAWVKERTKREPPQDKSLWDEDMKRAERVYGGSVAAEFFRLTGQRYGIRPISKLEVLEDVDPPRTESEDATAAVVKELAQSTKLDMSELGVAIAKALVSAGVVRTQK